MYERFEQIVALILSLIIAVVIVIALFQLITQIVPLVLGGLFDRLHYKEFQVSSVR